MGHSNFSCAICLDNFPITERVLMPCCGVEGSSVQYCKHCIYVIVRNGIRGYIGKCPMCPSYFTLQNGIAISQTNVQLCRMCLQQRVIADPRRSLCDRCLLGSEFTLQYACNRCNRNQRIPHPMWLYQSSPTEYGTSSWACHRGCSDYTMWRVTPEDAARIPPEHTPESWGRREVWLSAVREDSQRRAQTNDGDEPLYESNCLIA